MNTLKIFKTLTVFLVLTILTVLTGCSDQLMSPTADNLNSGIEAEKNIPTTIFNGHVELKPGQEYKFDYSNTGFYIFNSVSVSDCDLSRNGLEISGQFDDMIVILDCEEKGFWVNSVLVRNISGRLIEADVLLQGLKSKPRDPVSKRVND